MIVIASGLVGAALGVRGARRHQGTRGDQIQWATACGIAGCLIGVILTIAVSYMV